MLSTIKKSKKTNQKKNKQVKTYSSAFAGVLAFFATFTKQELIVMGVLAFVMILLAVAIIVLSAKTRKLKKSLKTEIAKTAENNGATVKLEQKVEEVTNAIKSIQSKLSENATTKEIAVTGDQQDALHQGYDKSFMARLIQCDDKCKEYYKTLKNTLLSYKKVKSRTSWNYESFNFGREKLVKLAVRGKTLNVYFALDATEYENTKYKVSTAYGKKYEGVNCLLKVNGDRKLKYALELISELAKKYALSDGAKKNDEYDLTYKNNDALLEEGLIKTVMVRDFSKNN